MSACLATRMRSKVASTCVLGLLRGLPRSSKAATALSRAGLKFLPYVKTCGS